MTQAHTPRPSLGHTVRIWQLYATEFQIVVSDWRVGILRLPPSADHHRRFLDDTAALLARFADHPELDSSAMRDILKVASTWRYLDHDCRADNLPTQAELNSWIEQARVYLKALMASEDNRTSDKEDPPKEAEEAKFVDITEAELARRFEKHRARLIKRWRKLRKITSADPISTPKGMRGVFWRLTFASDDDLRTAKGK